MNVRQIASRVESGQLEQTPPRTQSQSEQSARFADLLRLARQKDPPALQLSAHAQQRIQDRGIAMDGLHAQTISEAMTRLQEKGARDALLLRSDAAFVVNVPSRTVVTAIGRQEMTEKVFTNIDSAMVL